MRNLKKSEGLIYLRNKALEIAEVTKLKNLVQQHYEEIEFLRNERKNVPFIFTKT
jgi:hypothetical protein